MSLITAHENQGCHMLDRNIMCSFSVT